MDKSKEDVGKNAFQILGIERIKMKLRPVLVPTVAVVGIFYFAFEATAPSRDSTAVSRMNAVGPIVSQSESSNALSPTSSPVASKLCLPVAPGKRERYHLPPILNLPAGVTFATDWSRLPTGGWFAEQIMDTCRMRPDGFLTWHGKSAVRVEVQPKDDPLALEANSERAEMLTMQDHDGTPIRENWASGIQYYATSYYFPPNWHGEQLPWSAFAPVDCSKGNQNQCNSWSFVMQFYPWGGLSAAASSVGGPERYAFNGSLFTAGGLIALGKWTDLVFQVNWRTGAYTIWRRDQGQTNFAQVLTGIKPLNGDVYIKQGLYRGGDVNGRTDVLWIGPIARGTSFSAVEQQAFGTNSGDGLNQPR